MLKSLGGLAIAAAAAVYWGSPLLVVAEFSHAIATGDAEAVNGLIDFPALRSSLKVEAQQVALYRLSGHQKPGTNLLAGLASGVMEPFVNALVDTVATPEGIRGLLSRQGGPRRQTPPQVNPVPWINWGRWAVGWPRQDLAIALGTPSR